MKIETDPAGPADPASGRSYAKTLKLVYFLRDLTGNSDSETLKIEESDWKRACWPHRWLLLCAHPFSYPYPLSPVRVHEHA